VSQKSIPTGINYGNFRVTPPMPPCPGEKAFRNDFTPEDERLVHLRIGASWKRKII